MSILTAQILEHRHFLVALHVIFLRKLPRPNLKSESVDAKLTLQ